MNGQLFKSNEFRPIHAIIIRYTGFAAPLPAAQCRRTPGGAWATTPRRGVQPAPHSPLSPWWTTGWRSRLPPLLLPASGAEGSQQARRAGCNMPAGAATCPCRPLAEQPGRLLLALELLLALPHCPQLRSGQRALALLCRRRQLLLHLPGVGVRGQVRVQRLLRPASNGGNGSSSQPGCCST